jgi:hypothetical protein
MQIRLWLLLGLPASAWAKPFSSTAYCQCKDCSMEPFVKPTQTTSRDGFEVGWVDAGEDQCRCHCICDPIKYYNWDESATYCDWKLSPVNRRFMC